MFNTQSKLLVAALLSLLSWSTWPDEPIESLRLSDDIDIDILQIGSGEKATLIWFACNQGDETEEFHIARNLGKSGYRIFFPDMLSAHFLSPIPSNIAKIPAVEIEKVIYHIVELNPDSPVYVIGGARAAVPILKGLADERVKQLGDRLKGALLITPRVNLHNPVPGSEPEYIAEAGQSIHPIRILEGERTPNRWGLPHLAQTLAQSGSKVEYDLIKGVRGYFYLRGDRTPEEDEMTRQLDHIIDHNIHLLGAIEP